MKVDLVTLACLLFAVLLTCGVFCAASKSEEASNKPIKIGAVLPFSGAVALYGLQAKLGLDLAVQEINASGGILGHPLQIIYEDDKTVEAEAQKATRKLIETDGVLAVVGPITSQNLLAIEATIETLKTPLLYATNYEGGACSRYIFSFSTVPNQELSALLPYMSKTFGNSYFLLGADHTWPHKMFDAVEPIVSGLGGQIVGKEFITGSEKDFAPVIGRIASSKAKILVFAFKGPALQSFIRQARVLGLMKSTAIAFLGMSETDLPVIGKQQNMFVAVPFVATDNKPTIKKFVAEVKKSGGPKVTVSNYVMTHYNALLALKAALTKSGKIEKEALIDALEGLQIDTPTGALTIGKNHHVTMNMFLARTKGDQLVTVRSLGEIAPEPGFKCAPAQ